MCLVPLFSPLHIHGGDIKSHPFQPQHHEQTLGEGTVADALAVAPRLVKTQTTTIIHYPAYKMSVTRIIISHRQTPRL